MKQLIAGGIGIVSGVLLFGFTLVAAAVYSLHLREVGYSGAYGLFLSSLGEVGTIPIILSIVLFIAGLVFLYRSIDQKWWDDYFMRNEVEAKDKET